MIINLRQESSQDLEFLYQLYASTRTSEMALLPWDTAQKEDFLRMQFSAQRGHYLRYYPNASLQVIELDSRPVGRLYVDRLGQEIRVIEISLVPELRSQGIGTRLLGEIMEEARGAGKSVTVHVEIFNQARSLYQRLGFQVEQDQGVYLLMRWVPPEAQIKP